MTYLSSSDSSLVSDLRHLALGAVAGVLGTAVMTTFRMPISRSLPPTEEFWSKFVGRDAPLLVVFGLHALYGAGAGALFARVVGPVLRGRERRRERLGALLGGAYGLVMSAFGLAVVLERVLGMDLEPDERFVFHVGHLLYGLTLGTWLGAYGPSRPD